jgi:NADH dehydrogenase
MRVPLDSFLGPIGVDRVNARVESIDVDRRTVTARRRDGRALTASYDRLVLATGSKLVAPDFPGAGHVFDIDTIDAAVKLDDHLHQLAYRTTSPGQYTVVVVGAGFTGLEIATELCERLREVSGSNPHVRVVLVERADVPGPELGDAPRPVIAEALDDLRVEQRLGRTLVSASDDRIVLSDGEVIHTSTVVWTVGMAASPLTRQIPVARDRFGRLPVDEFLRVSGISGVYAAGDTAAAATKDGHTVIQSCQHALPMGKFAGHNVAADLIGLQQLQLTTDPYANAIDLGPAGALTTTGWERTVNLVGREAKAMKEAINTKWIYPPTESAEAILAAAGQFNKGG